MTITGHADRTVFERYNVRRDDVPAHALGRELCPVEAPVWRRGGPRAPCCAP
jgi:hypothetical protein